MIQKIARKLSQETGYSEGVLAYSLIIIWNTVAGYGLLIITAFLLGWLDVALAVAITYSTFRIVSGGAHASSNLRCIVIGTLVFNVLAFIVVSVSNLFKVENIVITVIFIMVTFLLALLVVYFYAPADVPEKPITSKKQRLALKTTAFSLLTICLLLGLIFVQIIDSVLVLASSFGLLWQSFSLTPLGYRVMGLFDKILKLIIRR